MIEININPVAFTLGSLEVRWYGILMALGVLVLILWTMLQIRRGAKLSYDNLLGAALVAIPSAIIFSRLLHLIDLWDYYGSRPGEWLGGSGLTIYGAIIGATLGIWVYSRFARLNFSYLMDVIAPGVILAQTIGRVGCLINGCCYGPEVQGLPWSVVYNNPNALAPLGVPTHPTVAYEFLFLLLLFGVFMAFRSKFKPDGVQFLFYLGIYSLWRIGIGGLRVGTPFLFGLEQAQVIGIIVSAIVFPLIIYRVRKLKSQPASIEAGAANEPESEVSHGTS